MPGPSNSQPLQLRKPSGRPATTKQRLFDAKLKPFDKRRAMDSDIIWLPWFTDDEVVCRAVRGGEWLTILLHRHETLVHRLKRYNIISQHRHAVSLCYGKLLPLPAKDAMAYINWLQHHSDCPNLTSDLVYGYL